MSVNLVTATPDGDKLIAYMARVSNPGNQNNHATGPKLIRSLLRDAHWSPLEMVNMVVEINTTRDIGRQILRHRSFTFQEFSQRYASVEALGEPVWRECRMQDTKNRQNSITNEDDKLSKWFQSTQEAVWHSAFDRYKAMLEVGIAKEQARALLPEGLTSTRMYMNGTLRSWVHFIDARMHPGAQKEIRELATQIKEVLKQNFPMVHEAHWSIE